MIVHGECVGLLYMVCVYVSTVHGVCVSLLYMVYICTRSSGHFVPSGSCIYTLYNPGGGVITNTYIHIQGCARDGRRWSALATTLKLPTATVLRRPPVGLGLTCSKIYRLFYSALLLNLSYYSPFSSNYSH